MKAPGRTSFFLAFIPVYFVFILLTGGCKDIDIMLHEARTKAIVTGLVSHGVIVCEYQVDGRTYTGRGDPGDPPYPRGSTFQIRYSKARPSFSSAQHPLTIFGEFLFGCAILVAIHFLANHGRSSPEDQNKRDTACKVLTTNQPAEKSQDAGDKIVKGPGASGSSSPSKS